MTATILDTITGERKTISGIDTYAFTEGNWSCDCNRDYPGADVSDRSFCRGACRFIVIEATQDGPDDFECTLEELNQNYPSELLRKYGIDRCRHYPDE